MLQKMNVKLLLISLGVLWLVTCVAVHKGWIIAYVVLHLATTGLLAFGIHSAEVNARSLAEVKSKESSEDSVNP